MLKYLFVYATKNREDRDSVCYIEDNDNHTDIRGHLIVYGPCFCGRDDKYEDIKTILTEEEYNSLMKGENYDKIVEKLKSKEAEDFKEKIMLEEIDFMKDKYDLSDDEVNEIMENYAIEGYFDKGIISYVWDDNYDLVNNLVTEFTYNGQMEPWLWNFILDNIDYSKIDLEAIKGEEDEEEAEISDREFLETAQDYGFPIDDVFFKQYIQDAVNYDDISVVDELNSEIYYYLDNDRIVEYNY